jgi:hypothetical protein
VRKVIVSEFVTLDGIMEAPEKWQSPYLSDDVVETIQAQILAYGAMLLVQTHATFSGMVR